MHEIEPQSDPRLAEALRRLAASSERSAPSALAVGLLAEFRRHHARRRRIQRTVVGTIILCFCVVITFTSLWFSRTRLGRHATSVRPAPALELKSSSTQETSAPGNVAGSVVRSSGRRRTVARNANTHGATDRAANRAFLALPDYDPTVPMDQLNVVRVQLTESALWKMGVPVPADAGARPVMADFVVSRDGTPFAVRLVQ